MTETNQPTPQSEQDSSSQTPASRIDALLARLTGNRIPLTWARYGGIAVLLVFALVIVGLMRNFTSGMQQLRQEELRATAQAMADAQIEAVTGGEASALMPSLGGASSPFNLGIHRRTQPDTIIPSRARIDIQTYTVAQGDSLFAIAERFGVKAESILWFNFSVLQDNPNFVEIGQELRIPPVDGVLHVYRTGENIESIIDQYSYSTDPSVEDVLDWPGNRLDPYETDPNNPGLADGALLVIPNGSRELRDWGPPAISRDNPAVAAYYGPGACGAIGAGAIGTGSFVWPTSVRQLSGYDYNPPLHPAIDIAGAEGNPIYATDGGVVVYAGWSNTGYGNLLVIDHGTGWQSAYAHMNSVAVTCGQNVGQGEYVGTLGSTGNSSGPHLHFELLSFSFGKVNPWSFLQ
ncbi:MAG: peptidoglycan DD-metalloendopeptidase family protein [Anaerolineales bacterium]|nr:peptidoglycan DD-metalloendopeptidase family protein [Anaerolineales bacterium]MCW5854922.1 peptidoglycan DD-metalloendopeptidase family protein [Anaerolineales bacterium]